MLLRITKHHLCSASLWTLLKSLVSIMWDSFLLIFTDSKDFTVSLWINWYFIRFSTGGDQGRENVGMVDCMFIVGGCGKASYISGKCVIIRGQWWKSFTCNCCPSKMGHSESWNKWTYTIQMILTCRVELVAWRVEQVLIPSRFSLEEHDLLDPSDSLHLFCAQDVYGIIFRSKVTHEQKHNPL